MDTIIVPEVTQTPHQSIGMDNPARFVDMLLTSLLVYDAATLYAEFQAEDSTEAMIIWRIQPRDEGVYSREIEIPSSSAKGSFRKVLACFGQHCMGDQPYNGYALRLLEQRGRVHRCHFYLSNSAGSGFWIRIYAALAA